MRIFVRVATSVALVLLVGCGESVGPTLDRPLVSVSNGVRHSCGLTADGTAFCWGWNERGQLGDGTELDRSIPVAVTTDLKFVQLSAGGAHSCGLVQDGSVYCWGLNETGQLGNGETSTGSNPEPTQVIGGVSFAYIDAGSGVYTCGLSTSGDAYCWGWNEFGQLGDGTDLTQTQPTLVETTEVFTSLYAHAFHTCGLTAAGEAWCWGRDDFAQLGTGVLTGENSLVPVAVAGGFTFTTLAVGFQHTCGLVAGEAHCWGRNHRGQTGTNTGTQELSPVPVVSGPLFSALATGANYTCGVSQASGEAFCWGANDLGQLGHLSPQVCTDEGTGDLIGCTPEPTLVDTELAFSALAGGTHHTCGLATDGFVYCWGRGEVGELGDGQTGATYRSIQPVRVSGQVNGTS